jgi:nucleoid-associated protein EbfC
MVPSDDDRELLGEVVEDDDTDDEGASPFAGIDMNALLEQAQSLQAQLMSAQAQAASQILEGRSGGGQVTVTISGEGEPLAVHIAKEVIDPDDQEMLEDLVLAAFKDALTQAQELTRNAMGGLGDLLGGGHSA